MSNDFYGLPTRVLENQHLRLDFLADAGPRIVRLFVAGGDENLLAESAGVKRETPYGDFFFQGGHRLWHAPEAFPRTYIPDNEGLQVEEIASGVRLTQPTETWTGIRKTLEITLDADRPGATLVHELQNDGPWPVTLAPWALTQVRLGGVAVLPQTSGQLDPDGLLPNRTAVFWPYMSVQDERLHIADDYILVHTTPKIPPCKVGYLNSQGWVGYLRAGTFFLKEFEPQPEREHPDFNCNVEVYCDNQFLELETLAPLHHLEPGQTAQHVETWTFYTGLDDLSQDADGVRQLAERLSLWA